MTKFRGMKFRGSLQSNHFSGDDFPKMHKLTIFLAAVTRQLRHVCKRSRLHESVKKVFSDHEIGNSEIRTRAHFRITVRRKINWRRQFGSGLTRNILIERGEAWNYYMEPKQSVRKKPHKRLSFVALELNIDHILFPGDLKADTSIAWMDFPNFPKLDRDLFFLINST